MELQDNYLRNTFYSSSFSDEERKEFKKIITDSVDAEPVIYKLTPEIHKGQYRLSYRLLEKLSLLTTKNISGKNNNSSNKEKKYEFKITKMELLLLILLLQMCDGNNSLYDFSYTKDIEPLHDFSGAPLFCKSTFYNIFNSLQRKKIIKVQEQENGTITVSVPDNQIHKNERYIPLQTEFLLHDSEHYLAFRNMKLASMKLYLFYIASTYTGAGSALNNSPSMSIEQIKTRMGIRQNRTVRTYIKSLEKAFGHLSFVPGGGRKAFIKGRLFMSNLNNRFCFAKREKLSDSQPNSFRRYFDRTIQLLDVETDENYNNLRNWTYSLLSDVESFDISELFSYIVHSVSLHKKLDLLTFSDYAKTISNAYTA